MSELITAVQTRIERGHASDSGPRRRRRAATMESSEAEHGGRAGGAMRQQGHRHVTGRWLCGSGGRPQIHGSGEGGWRQWVAKWQSTAVKWAVRHDGGHAATLLAGGYASGGSGAPNPWRWRRRVAAVGCSMVEHGGRAGGATRRQARRCIARRWLCKWWRRGPKSSLGSGFSGGGGSELR
jgi:hypothetical protein